MFNSSRKQGKNGRSPGLETGVQVGELCIAMRQVVILREEDSTPCRMMMARAVENSDFAATATRDREQLSQFGEDLGATVWILRHHLGR